MIIYNNPEEFNQVRFAQVVTSPHLTENNGCPNFIIPTTNDVLNGRGKSIHAWQGNVYYRDLIQYYKLEYIVATPEEQKNIAIRIISTIRGLNPRGRFLETNKASGAWCDIGDEKSIFKVRQALREGAPQLRQQLTPNEIGTSLQDTMNDCEYRQLVEMIFLEDGMDCSEIS